MQQVMARFSEKVYWEHLGISKTDRRTLGRAIANLTYLSLGIMPSNCEYGRTIPEAISNLMNIINGIEAKYNLTDHHMKLPGQPQTITVESGLEMIARELSIPGRIVGVAGMPASGKTTLLHRLSQKGFYTIDEFWKEGADYQEGENMYPAEIREVQQRKEKRKSTVVAASTVDPSRVDYIAFLITIPQTRLHNLKKRCSDENNTDAIRIKHFDIYEKIDFFKYGLQRIQADIVIDTSRVRY
jgi:hypothetical protein